MGEKDEASAVAANSKHGGLAVGDGGGCGDTREASTMLVEVRKSRYSLARPGAPLAAGLIASLFPEKKKTGRSGCCWYSVPMTIGSAATNPASAVAAGAAAMVS